MRVNTNPKPPSPTRRLREKRGMTREQLAVKAKIASSTLYLVECAGLLSDAVAEKLAGALGVSPEDLRP